MSSFDEDLEPYFQRDFDKLLDADTREEFHKNVEAYVKNKLDDAPQIKALANKIYDELHTLNFDESVKALREQGFSRNKIAKELGAGHSRVQQSLVNQKLSGRFTRVVGGFLQRIFRAD